MKRRERVAAVIILLGFTVGAFYQGSTMFLEAQTGALGAGSVALLRIVGGALLGGFFGAVGGSIVVAIIEWIGPKSN